jgi:G3E family GTPase
MPPSAITPVTVLTGFLGSGKTTLLNRLLRDPRFADTAVIVNEWGAVPVDHALVREASDNVVVLPGGCLCCRLAGDLTRALRELHHQRAAGEIGNFRRVVVETTGLADPAPLLATLVEMPVVAARYALAGVVATLDAEHGMATLDAHPEAVKQAAMAERLVVTKTDRVAPSALAGLDARLATLNPGALRLHARHGEVDATRLLDMGLHRGEAPAPDAAGWLNEGAYRRVGAGATAVHDPRITSFVWSTAQAVAWEDLEAALRTLLGVFGARILRLKGLARIAGEPGPRAVHAVQHTLYPSARLAAWPDASRDTRLVFIGRDLEESEAAPILQSFLTANSSRGTPWQPSNPRT